MFSKGLEVVDCWSEGCRCHELMVELRKCSYQMSVEIDGDICRAAPERQRY